VDLEGKRILVTGGTGSLGKVVVRRLLGGEMGRPARITVFSRDEAKQHYMRLSYLHRAAATDEVIYRNFQELLSFRIGDVRDYAALLRAVSEADVVIHAAALKQVPVCEYFPYEAVQTNIVGPQNLVRAIAENETPVQTVVGISTDKACKPINVMGMTKALQERIFIEANMDCPRTRFVCVRYGNVIASRFGGAVVSGSDCPRRAGDRDDEGDDALLLSLTRRWIPSSPPSDQHRLARLIFPDLPAARVLDVAEVLIDGREIAVTFTGIRPGEKIHEIMVSEEECYRTIERGSYYVIRPMLPELQPTPIGPPALMEEYSSSRVTLDQAGLRALLQPYLHVDMNGADA
jgi:UDP-glucose 4-epimerase